MARVAEKDPAAFEILYDRYSAPLFSLAFRILRSRAEAEDILQESFLKIWKIAPNYEPARGSVFTWLAMIVRCRAIDALRKNSRSLPAVTKNDEDELTEVSPLPWEHLANRESGERIRQALCSLEKTEQRVIRLAFFDGFTHVEISAALALPIGTVKARVRRGMLKLRDRLRHQPA